MTDPDDIDYGDYLGTCEACGEAVIHYGWKCCGCGVVSHDYCEDPYVHPETGEKSCASCRAAEVEASRP